jgi:hypothetical protein
VDFNREIFSNQQIVVEKVRRNEARTSREAFCDCQAITGWSSCPACGKLTA